MANRRPPPKVPTGEEFHVPGARVYAEPVGPAIHKRGEAMARVVYSAVHENRAFPLGDDRRGHGRDHATWIFSEEPGLEERLFHSGLELMIDARLEPGAAIGLHRHTATEEVYYVLEGQLSMTTVLADGREVSADLRPGDAHGVRLGESHWGRAGSQGCRFLAVAFRRR
jgi:quercetin dioxygenase-like cupin family protein